MIHSKDRLSQSHIILRIRFLTLRLISPKDLIVINFNIVVSVDTFILKTYNNDILSESNSIAFYNINNNDFLEIEINK
jgi:hypothetical protein